MEFENLWNEAKISDELSCIIELGNIRNRGNIGIMEIGGI